MTFKHIDCGLIQHLDPSALLEGAEVSEYKKYIAGYASAYLDSKTAETMTDTLAYTVRSFTPNDPKLCAQPLAWGVTSMEPVTVNGEYNLTRGHFHADTDYPEYYLCVSGEGMIILWDGKDEIIVQDMKPGSLHWIDGRYAHRCVNTGKTQMNFIACWSTHAGHNYGAIEEAGFPVRIFEENGKPVIKEM